MVWRSTLNSFVVYQLCFWALAAFFFTKNYILSRTSTFVSLHANSGVCKGDRGSTLCCEVPKSVTGSFLADAAGRWDTFPHFNYNQNNYNLYALGVKYTNEEYRAIMRKIGLELRVLGARGANRDYSWNMIAWSSFTSLNSDAGNLKFTLSGNAGIIFDKPIVGVGVASNNSDLRPCDSSIIISNNPVTRRVSVRIDLGCNNPPCQLNPCPGILSPQAMGYDTMSATSSSLDFSLDIATISTALAVNMGILPLTNLVEYKGDNSRLTLLENMVREGFLSSETAANTSSYYGERPLLLLLFFCILYVCVFFELLCIHVLC